MSARRWIGFDLAMSAWAGVLGVHFAINGAATSALVMGLICGLYIGAAAVEATASHRRSSARSGSGT